MKKYLVELTVNESQGLNNVFADMEKANFEVPSSLESFYVYGNDINDAIKQASEKLEVIANDKIEVYHLNKEEECAEISFSNSDDGLGITYEISLC